jgi:hypothetical protein
MVRQVHTKRIAIGAAVLALVALGIVVHDRAGSTRLRATVGHCTADQRRLHAAACAYIEANPAIVLAGPPVDKYGTPADQVIVRADAHRRVNVGLRAGTYGVFLVIDHHGTIRTSVLPKLLAVPKGGLDIHQITPGIPWEFTGVPGA